MKARKVFQKIEFLERTKHYGFDTGMCYMKIYTIKKKKDKHTTMLILNPLSVHRQKIPAFSLFRIRNHLNTCMICTMFSSFHIFSNFSFLAEFAHDLQK